MPHLISAHRISMPFFKRFQLAPTPPLFRTLLLVSLSLAMVPLVFPALDIGAAGLFFGPTGLTAAKQWWWVEAINLYVPMVFRWFLGVALMAWLVSAARPTLKTWRLPLAFAFLSGVLGPGLVVNSVFKDNWQRARPYQVQAFGGPQHFTRAAVISNECDNNCSFVSGHVSCGFFFTALLLVHHRRQRAWAIVGTTLGLMIGFARVADMAHWFSDVLWAYPIVLATSWLVWQTLLQITEVNAATGSAQAP